MNKSLAFIALALSLSAFGFSHSRNAPAPVPIPSQIAIDPGIAATPSPSRLSSDLPISLPSGVSSPVPAPSPVPLPSPLAKRLIQVANITGAQAGEIEMIHAGEMLANAMLAKPCFKQWVLAARYSETNGLTQQQILDKIESEPARVDVELYYENNRTVGFEYDPFDGVVHMNRKFVNSASDAAERMLFGSMAADNLLHEDRGHGLGWHHYGKFSTSVPYGMNYAYEGCASAQQQMLAKGARGHYRPKGLRIEVRHKHPRPFERKFPASHRHKSDARCRNKAGKLIPGCVL